MVGTAGILQLQQMIQRIINLSVSLAFIALTIMLVVAGIKYMTAGGDQKALQGAQQTATWAILGIGAMLLAWLALVLIEQFTGAPVTQFCIGFPGSPTVELDGSCKKILPSP